MSVTFWCPEAPTFPTVPYPEQDPDFIVQKSSLPELQLANGNARLALDLLGMPPDEEMAGTLEVAELDAALVTLKSSLRSVIADSVLEHRNASTADANPGSALGRLLSQKLSAPAAHGELALSGVQVVEMNPFMPRATTGDSYAVNLVMRLGDLLTQARTRGYRVSWG